MTNWKVLEKHNETLFFLMRLPCDFDTACAMTYYLTIKEPAFNNFRISDLFFRPAFALQKSLHSEAMPRFFRLNAEQKSCASDSQVIKGSFLRGDMMQIYNATEARSSLYQLIDQTATSHAPIVITGKRNNAVLLSEEDWTAINETLYLLSVPNMRESIREGLKTDIATCSDELDW